jgi:hypothetical protein
MSMASRAEGLAFARTPKQVSQTSCEKIVMLGEVTGPGQCSNQVDTFGKECLEENKLLYQYREDAGVPPLAVSRCGDSIAMNSFLNQETSLKKL